MEIPVKIITDNEDNTACGAGCPFLEDSSCLLFSKELEETVLPVGHIWNDNISPTRDRCYQCLMMG